MTPTTIAYRSGYTLSHDYNCANGEIEITATIDEGESPDESYEALRKLVRSLLKSDYMDGRRLVGLHQATAKVATK